MFRTVVCILGQFNQLLFCVFNGYQFYHISWSLPYVRVGPCRYFTFLWRDNYFYFVWTINYLSIEHLFFLEIPFIVNLIFYISGHNIIF